MTRQASFPLATVALLLFLSLAISTANADFSSDLNKEKRQIYLKIPVLQKPKDFFDRRNSGHFPYKAMVHDNSGYWSGDETFTGYPPKCVYADFYPFIHLDGRYFALATSRCAEQTFEVESKDNFLFQDSRLTFQTIDLQAMDSKIKQSKTLQKMAIQPRSGERWFAAHRPKTAVEWANNDGYLSFGGIVEAMTKKTRWALYYSNVQASFGAYFDFAVLYGPSTQTYKSPALTGLILGRGPKQTIDRVLVQKRVKMTHTHKLHVINLVTPKEHSISMWSSLDEKKQKTRWTTSKKYAEYSELYPDMHSFRNQISEYIGSTKDHYSASEINSFMATVFGVQGLIGESAVYVHCWAGQTRSGGIAILIIFLSYMCSITENKEFTMPYYKVEKVRRRSETKNILKAAVAKIKLYQVKKPKANEKYTSHHIQCFVGDSLMLEEECFALIMYQISRTILGLPVVTHSSHEALVELQTAETELLSYLRALKQLQKEYPDDESFKKIEDSALILKAHQKVETARLKHQEASKGYSKRLKTSLHLRGDLLSVIAFIDLYVPALKHLFIGCFGANAFSTHMKDYADHFENRWKEVLGKTLPPQPVNPNEEEDPRYLTKDEVGFLKNIAQQGWLLREHNIHHAV